MSSERFKKKTQTTVLLIGKIRKIKFIMQTELANEVYFSIHTAYACARKISPER